MIRAWFRFIFVMLLVSPDDAYSCATCGFGQDASTGAFIATTWILTFVPLAFIGGIVYWIYRKHQKARLTSTPEISS